MVAYTPILKLTQPDFDQTPWDEAINNDLSILDAAYGKLIGAGGLAGAWQNAATYIVGQLAVDTISSSLWTCLISHTSAASPTTFAQDRAANPSYWTSSGAVLVYLPITGGTLTGNLGITGNLNVTGSGTIAALLNAGTVHVTADIAASSLSLTGSASADVVTANTITATTINGGGTISASAVAGIAINGGTVAASNSIMLPVAGGSITANATIVSVALNSVGWRWDFVRSSGTLRWINGATGQTLMSIDNAGNVICKGTITSNGTPV